MQDLGLLFEQLKSASNAGIYRLFDDLEKRCYISYSSNISKSLVRLLDSNLFLPGFSFEILELVTDNINLRPRCQYFKDLYSSNRWAIINPKRVSNCKVRIEVIPASRRNPGSQSVLAVKVVSRGYKEVTVGIFNDYTDMMSFLDQYYAGNLVTKIVYADNELTKRYMNEKI